jgi:transketolase
MNDLEKRVIDISYKNKIGHLSSNLNAVNIIDEIYKTKQSDEVFILSSGHAALALYCVIEKYKGISAEKLFNLHGVHPHRDLENDLHCSTGSLGMGLTVACGYALSNRSKNVYCLISDGECGEGSIWEALRFVYESKLDNLKVFVNINGMIAYDFIDKQYLINRLNSFLPSINIRETFPPELPNASGILTHYYVLTEEDYEKFVW